MNGGEKVKSDYNKNDFWIKDNKYFLRVKGDLIEVSKEVYNLCRNDYLHNLQSIRKEIEYGHLSLDFCDQEGKSLVNILSDIDKKNYHIILNIIKDYLTTLDNRDKTILTLYLFEDMNDSQIAKHLNISRQVVNYRKEKILKNLRMILTE